VITPHPANRWRYSINKSINQSMFNSLCTEFHARLIWREVVGVSTATAVAKSGATFELWVVVPAGKVTLARPSVRRQVTRLRHTYSKIQSQILRGFTNTRKCWTELDLCQILTDFQNSFTSQINGKRRTWRIQIAIRPTLILNASWNILLKLLRNAVRTSHILKLTIFTR